MKTNFNQQTITRRCQYALTCVKKKASYIKRAYRGEVYVAWHSTRPFHIAVIETPVAAGGLLDIVEGPPPYSKEVPVLQKFKPQDVKRCLDDSARTLHEISQALSHEAPRSSFQKKKLSYGEVAGCLRQTAANLREMRASELREMGEIHESMMAGQ